MWFSAIQIKLNWKSGSFFLPNPNFTIKIVRKKTLVKPLLLSRVQWDPVLYQRTVEKKIPDHFLPTFKLTSNGKGFLFFFFSWFRSQLFLACYDFHRIYSWMAVSRHTALYLILSLAVMHSHWSVCVCAFVWWRVHVPSLRMSCAQRTLASGIGASFVQACTTAAKQRKKNQQVWMLQQWSKAASLPCPGKTFWPFGGATEAVEML